MYKSISMGPEMIKTGLMTYKPMKNTTKTAERT